MNAEQKATWDAYFDPHNQSFFADYKAGKYKNSVSIPWTRLAAKF